MKISFSLNAASMDAAIRQLEEYRDSLPVKADQIRKRVAELLGQLVEEGFNGAEPEGVIYGETKVPNVSVEVKPDEDNISLVIAHGKEAVFIEFGAGVYYNPGGGRPDRPPGIVKIGEYGKGYGKRQVWGYYEDGELKLTHGTPASMPMFYAAREIAKRIPDIAKEVFKGGEEPSST